MACGPAIFMLDRLEGPDCLCQQLVCTARTKACKQVRAELF